MGIHPCVFEYLSHAERDTWVAAAETPPAARVFAPG
jgi:hypothetical protein